MEMKAAVAGILVTALSFGAGVAIPILSDAGFSVSSYEQAQTVLSGVPVTETIGSSVQDGRGEDTADSEQQPGKKETSADSATGQTESPETATGGESVANTDSDPIGRSDTKTVEEEENFSDTVVFDWDYRDWEIGNVRLTEHDFESVADFFGLDLIDVRRTDFETKAGLETEWNGKIARILYSAIEQKGKNSFAQRTAHFDGEKYLSGTFEELPAGTGIWARILVMSLPKEEDDGDNYRKYWSVSYEADLVPSGRDYDLVAINHEDGITEEDKKEIERFVKLPFLGGTVEDLEAAFHLSEIRDKGTKRQTQSEDEEYYVVMTNYGKCNVSIQKAEYEHDGQKDHQTVYGFTFDDPAYAIYTGFTEGEDNPRYVHYEVPHLP